MQRDKAGPPLPPPPRPCVALTLVCSADAAGLMLQHKVHRLPVVTRTGECVGMLTRGDVFKPLVPGFTATSVTTPEKKARGEAYAAIKAKLDRMRSTRLQASE